ncbi:MAG: serine protease Do [Hyphomicrobiaceae bacterium]
MRPATLLAATFALSALGVGATSLSTSPLATAAGFLPPNSAYAHLPALDVADIAERTVRSVVNISTTKLAKVPHGQDMSPLFNDPMFRRFFEVPPGAKGPHQRRSRSLGSGVIVSAEGVILTNEHVVTEADEIKVTLSDGREFDAEFVGADPSSDIGVIRLKEQVDGLEPLPFGSSAALRLGETVIAIGNPFGVGQTVTMGIVSALGRANVGIVDYEDFIQTDAAINPGNSGGALINLKGELVGINTAIVSRSGGYQGIGFAIPSDMAQSIMDNLITHGRVLRGWLGVMIQNIDSDMADALGLESQGGVLVSDVSEDSPALEAGVEVGDVIIQVDGTTVDSTGALRNKIAGSGAGTKVKLGVLRNGKRKNIKVLLGELPADLTRPSTGPGRESAADKVGMRLAELSDETREKFEVSDKVEQGVVVADVAVGSVAAEAGLRPGQVILEIDREKIDSVDNAIESLVEGDRHLLLVWQDGGTAFIVLKLEAADDADDADDAEPNDALDE